MRTVELSGNYEALGHQYGAALAAVGFSPQPLTPEKRSFVRASRPAVKTHTPDLLCELDGLAAAGGWEPAPIAAIPIALGYEAGCSVVAVSGEHTVDGSPRFGRNYDCFTSFADFAELFRTDPADGLASVGCSDHWTGRQDGVNEVGLAVGHTFVPNDGPQPGIMFGLATRWVLDNCRTVSEAVAFLERIPHARNTTFVMADANGAVAIVEASPERVRTRAPDDGIAVATNHFLSAEMRAYEPEDADRTNSERRYEALTDWFETRDGPVDTAGLQRELADPEHGVCACGTENGSASVESDPEASDSNESNDGESDPNESDPVETLWSWTAALEEPSTQLAAGRPDETPYESIDLSS